MKPNTVGRDVGPMAGTSISSAMGLLANSIILTLSGETRVKDLRAGDRIITRDSGTAVLRGLRKTRVRAQAVRIKAGSLGHTRPERDVTLPAGQPVLIRDWRAKALFGRERALVAAHRLADGEFVTLHDAARMTLYTLEFDAAHVLYVDGLELGSHDARGALSTAA